MTVRDDALKFLEAHTAGVLATAENNVPHASTIFYIGDLGFNIHFVTQTTSAKYSITQNNPRVAFTVADVNTPQQLQIEGTVQRMHLDKILDKEVVEIFIKAHSLYYPAPITKLDQADIAFMLIKPERIRWADFAFAKNGSKNVFADIPVNNAFAHRSS